MVLQHLGHNVSAQQVLTVRNSYIDDVGVLGLLQHFGLTGCSIDRGGFDNNDKLAICLIHDNNNADPSVTGSFEHFIVVYAQDANNVYCANPWGARDIAYPLSQFNPAYIDCVIIPIAQNTVTPPAPAPTHIPGENDVILFADAQASSSAKGSVYLLSGGLVVHIVDPADLAEITKAQSDPTHIASLSDGTAAAIVAAAQAARTLTMTPKGSVNVSGSVSVG